jgi:hypothetical protein
MSGRHISGARLVFKNGSVASSALVLGASVLGAWILAAAPVRADPFRFPWDPPPPSRQETRPNPPQEPQLREQRPLAPARLSTRQVRAILAREGAQMIGNPRAIRDELIVLGRDSNGEGRKYILDAISGDVLAVEDALLPDRPRDRLDDHAPPGGSPPPPVHAPSFGDDRIESAPLAAPPTSPPVASAPPAAAAAPPPVSARSPDSSDTALSPIKPLRPLGAPRVEPLPK